MAKCKDPPELVFQRHISDFLVRMQGYCLLEQSEITDTENFIAEDHLWAFLKVTQADKLKKLADDYGIDARDEVFRALHKELKTTPLWMIQRQGLPVRGLEFHLYYPKPRSLESTATEKHGENRITLRPHFYYGETNKEIDFVLYLNGLPIVALELKHEKNQNVHDAVAQFASRDHSKKIFQHPFLYLAADTSDVMAASDPSHVENFRWYNTGLTNTPQTDGEYPVEYLYREVLSKDHLLEMLSFFLIRVPKREAEEDKWGHPAYTILPRYHQSRLVRKLAEDASAQFAKDGDIGKKYLINHSAGSGKTLSICWLADRLHSLFKPGTNEKLVDIVFILTDRKSLDTNIREDIRKFTHLRNIVGLARRATDLPRYIAERKPIIITTQQKFAWILEVIAKKPELKNLRVAFLIDEAHRSQEGRMGVAIRVPFRKSDEPDTEETPEEAPDEEEEIAKIIREHDRNQLFVAFTATPAPATITLFGSPFDTYSESEAIAEGYIVDVAASIISYKTLYNLHCPIIPTPNDEKVYPKGVVSKALQNVAYQDEGLIQYKSEVMLRIFEKDVKPLVDGRAKAMIVASSRLAGLRYFDIIKEKLKERNADYKVLYAFSDFVHPVTYKEISEHAINELKDSELIEDRFEGDDYRLMIVANKFQTGFNQPLLAGMFLDKPVIGRNAVQTVSRLNRDYQDKKDVVVVDFTNNAKGILKAFAQYRQGTPFEPEEPSKELCLKLYSKILETEVFKQSDAVEFLNRLSAGTDAEIQSFVNSLRTQFQTKISSLEDRKAFAYLLSRFVKSFHFLTCFFSYHEDIQVFAKFAEYVGPQLIKQGALSDLMKQIRRTEVIKAAVEYQGVTQGVSEGTIKQGHGRKGTGVPPKKLSVQDMISEIQTKFQISDEEALYIKQVTQEKIADPAIHQTVKTHSEDRIFLEGAYRGQVNGEIQKSYITLGRYEELSDLKYTDTGGIFDIMSVTVIGCHLVSAE
jgi:type I restriction enzyme R subunit